MIKEIFLICATAFLFGNTLFACPNQDSLTVPTKCKHYKDGAYYGDAMGYITNVSVCVTVKKHKVNKVEVVKHAENRPLNTIDFIPRRIKNAKTIDEVEAVTGATITSNAIKKAVKKALTKALIKTEAGKE